MNVRQVKTNQQLRDVGPFINIFQGSSNSYHNQMLTAVCRSWNGLH